VSDVYCVQVFWFGPLLGGACGGAVFDVIFSTKSSFTRIRNCFTVFHMREDAEMKDKGRDVEHDEPADGEEQGEHRKDGTAPTDELETLNENKDRPSSEQKPRRGTSLYTVQRDIVLHAVAGFWRGKLRTFFYFAVLIFSARQHICYSALYAIARPSLSVTRVDQSKTVEVRITQPSPQSSPMTLVS